MGKVEEYRRAPPRLAVWEPFLLERSGLPGPRGNLEPAAVAEEADEASLRRWAALGPAEAPFGSAEEFLPCVASSVSGGCSPPGTGQSWRTSGLAADPRWRIREAVAMALQRFGDADLAGLLAEMRRWARGTPLERRAAVASPLRAPPTRGAGPCEGRAGAPRAGDDRASCSAIAAATRSGRSARRSATPGALRWSRFPRKASRSSSVCSRATTRTLDHAREPAQEASRAMDREWVAVAIARAQRR